MDMFMDKLAQKVTAQEIIKANTTAETAELNRLRNQIDEYDQCLVKLKLLLQESAEKLQGGGAGNGELSILMERSIYELNSRLQQNAAQNEQLQQMLTERLESVNKGIEERFDDADRKLGERLGNVDRIVGERLESVDKVLENLDGALDERLDKMDSAFAEQLAGLNRSLSEKLSQLDDKLAEPTDVNLDGQLDERLSGVSESVHKECVKVYRNVQAVVLEESGKQTEAMTGTASSVQRVSKKLNTVFSVSVAALILSLLSAAIQILSLLNIKLF